MPVPSEPVNGIASAVPREAASERTETETATDLDLDAVTPCWLRCGMCDAVLGHCLAPAVAVSARNKG